MTTLQKSISPDACNKTDPSGPAGALAALQRAAITARKVAQMTHTKVITIADSSVPKQLNTTAKF
jgi:hypothetical protein